MFFISASLSDELVVVVVVVVVEALDEIRAAMSTLQSLLSATYDSATEFEAHPPALFNVTDEHPLSASHVDPVRRNAWPVNWLAFSNFRNVAILFGKPPIVFLPMNWSAILLFARRRRKSRPFLNSEGKRLI